MDTRTEFPDTIAAVVDRCAAEGKTTHEAMGACSDALVDVGGASRERIGKKQL